MREWTNAHIGNFRGGNLFLTSNLDICNIINIIHGPYNIGRLTRQLIRNTQVCPFIAGPYNMTSWDIYGVRVLPSFSRLMFLEFFPFQTINTINRPYKVYMEISQIHFRTWACLLFLGWKRVKESKRPKQNSQENNISKFFCSY